MDLREYFWVYSQNKYLIHIHSLQKNSKKCMFKQSVYNDHPRDPKFVAVPDRCLFSKKVLC